MARIQKVNLGGQEFTAREEDFEITTEDWSEYKLLDGGRVRLKVTVQRILRVLDAEGKPAYTAEGDPHILVRHTTQIVATEA